MTFAGRSQPKRFTVLDYSNSVCIKKMTQDYLDLLEYVPLGITVLFIDFLKHILDTLVVHICTHSLTQMPM